MKDLRIILSGFILMLILIFTNSCKNRDMHDSLTEPGSTENGFATGDWP